MFENTSNGIYHTGVVWDAYQDLKINFLYICPSTEKVERKAGPDSRFIKDSYPLDYLIVGALNFEYLERIIQMLDSRIVRTVIMPYLTPEERKEVILKYAREEKVVSDSVQLFLADPYQYMVESGVKKIYMIIGNGPEYDESEYLDQVNFEPIDNELQREIYKREGHKFTVYKAGYIIYGNWLLYFGNYGKGAETTIVMYHGSIDDNPDLVDSTLCVRNFSKLHECQSDITSSEFSCDIKCNYKNDYDCLRRHNRRGMKEYINGTFLLGNMRVLGNVELLYQRFGIIKEKVRMVAVPNSGCEGYWDRRLLGFGMEHYRRYWIGVHNQLTSAEMIKDIYVGSPHNRFMLVDDYFGVCMSGFFKYRSDFDSM
jgi:hypothetical protein